MAPRLVLACVAPLLLLPAAALLASSHREAPFISELRPVDGTDLYMFRSYEAGRGDFVTLIANYIPLQDPTGGPIFYPFDETAAYDINIDNDGDAVEDLKFRFRFTNAYQNVSLSIGAPGSQQSIAVPVINTVPGGIGPGVTDRNGLNRIETYSVTLVRDGTRGAGQALTNGGGGDTPSTFVKPVDYIGTKSINDYPAYARNHIYDVNIPGCGTGQVFVGQRKEPFFVNVGEIFDLINTDPLGPRDAEPNDLENKNVTSLALEIPIACLTAGSEPVIGAWTTSSVRQARIVNPRPRYSEALGRGNATFTGGAFVQVSRLGNPLVNEVVVGMKDKDRFNASSPGGDGQFLKYVTNPTLPELIEALFGSAGVQAPNNFPRNDLVATFLTGIPELNQPANVVPGEMLRLNTSIAPVAVGAQNNLGVLGGDTAGFPNGRRPGDDVVDIELRVAMGVLCTLNDPDVFGCVPGDAPSGALPYTDGVLKSASDYDEVFPYLRTPLPGAPN